MELELVICLTKIRQEYVDNIVIGFTMSGYFIKTEFEPSDYADPKTYSVYIYRRKS